MKKISILFLQLVVILIGVGTLLFLIIEPQHEGRNQHATLYEVYFNDPFLIYAYTASVAFFTALFQVFKLLNFVRQNRIFSPASVKALRIIKYCAIILIAFVAGAIAYFFLFQAGKGEDIAGAVALGLILIFISAIIGTAAGLFEKILQNAVDLKSENDLTI
jgi:hypothetical protein